MKIFFRIFLALIVLIVAGVVAVPFIFTPDYLAQQVAQQVKERTGRTLTFGGSPSLSIFPNVAIMLKDATLSNPPGLPQGAFVSMESLRLKVALQPLMQRRVEVREFVLNAPKVNLLVTGKGRVNWSFASSGQGNAPAAAASGSANSASEAAGQVANALAPTDIAIGPVKIKDGTLLYLDERSGGSFRADNVNLDINMPRIGGSITAAGNLVWKKQAIALNLKVTEPVKLATGGATSLQVSVSSKPLAISYAGAISLKDGFQMNGALNAKAPSLRNLAAWTGQPFAPGNGLGAFAIKSQVAYANDKLTLTKAKLSLDQTNAQGSIVVLLKSSVPVVSARLGVDQIDVNYYVAGGQDKKAAADGNSSGGGAASTKAGWSTKPINFGGLRAGAANLALSAGRIIYGKTTLSNVSMTAKLHRGVLTANLKKMNLYGGGASGQIVLNGSKKVPVISGSLKASGVKSLPLMRDFANFDWIEGVAAVNLKLVASGRSQAQLVQTLRGNLGVKFANGAIRGVDIDRLLGDVSKNILNGWNLKPSDRTRFKEVSANFNIQKGRASTDALKFIGPKVRITGKGNVNLPPRTLNFRFAPAYVASLQGKDVKSPVADLSKLPIKVKGPWASPKIYPDVKGILENPELAYKTIDGLLTNTGVLKEGQSKEALKKAEQETIDKAEKALAKELGDENAAAVKDASKKLLKGLFGNNE